MAGPRSGGSPASGGPAAGTVLRVLYGALAAGVVVFAAVVFLLLEPGAAGLDADLFRWAWLGLAVLAILAAGIVRARLRRGEASADRVRATAVTVWALAEGQALFALVAHLLGGDRTTGILGLLVFAYLFLRHRPSTFDPPGSRAPR